MTEAQKNEAVKMFQAGRSYKENGEQIGVTPGSVKQFFYRRRKQPFSHICEQCHQPIRLSSIPAFAGLKSIACRTISSG